MAEQTFFEFMREEQKKLNDWYKSLTWWEKVKLHVAIFTYNHILRHWWSIKRKQK